MLDMEERLQSLKDGALEFANVLRFRDNAPSAGTLSAGFRRRSDACTIASTANDGRGGKDRWEVGPRGAILVGPLGGQKCAPVPVPEPVLEFIAAFDAGMYPQLDRDAVLEAVAA